MKIHYLLFFAFATTQLPAQTIGVFFSQDVISQSFFPDKSVHNPYLLHSYREGSRGENRSVLSDHYDFKVSNNFGVSAFFEDLFKISFLNYVELGYRYDFNDVVRAGNILDRDEKLIGMRSGSYSFYEYWLHSFDFAIGFSKNWNVSKKLYLKSIITIQSSYLFRNEIGFSHRRPGDTGDLGDEALLAQNRLYTLNVGLNTQHRIGYNISERFSVFAGFNLGAWLNPVSRSNQDYLDYLDTFEDEYGKLYKVRKGPFPYLGWQVGVVYHFKKSLK